MKSKFQDLMSQPMTRREFLRNIGLLCLSIVGIHSALSILSSGNSNQRVVHEQVIKYSRGFGGGKFGV